MNKCITIAAIALQGLIANAQGPATSAASGPAFQFTTAKTALDERQARVLVGMPGRTVTGRPVSATEERHTLQILGDGTRIENTNTDKFYRDDLGRTRTERSDGTVNINDPVQGATAEIDSSGNVVHRSMRKADLKLLAGAVVETELRAQLEKAQLEKNSAELKVQLDTASTDLKAQIEKTSAEGAEDLGYQSVNGVTAQGFRTTTTIPAGKIGNDRPIQIVSERWYSQDLQMNVKTSNSDPRFGETTYQLTNILQAAPDPTLFQIPATSK